MDIYSVQNRAADFIAIPLFRRRRAGAFPRGMAEITAGAGIHCRHHGYGRGIGNRARAANYCNLTVLKWLTKRLLCTAVKFGKFIHKQHAVVGKADFTRARRLPAAVSPCAETVW